MRFSTTGPCAGGGVYRAGDAWAAAVTVRRSGIGMRRGKGGGAPDSALRRSAGLKGIEGGGGAPPSPAPM